MLPVVLVAAILMGALAIRKRTSRDRSLLTDDTANISAGVLTLIVTIVGAVVAFLVLSSMSGTFLDSLGTFLTSLVDVEIGDSQAANITELVIQSFAILVGVGGALFLVGYALAAVKTRKA